MSCINRIGIVAGTDYRDRREVAKQMAGRRTTRPWASIVMLAVGVVVAGGLADCASADCNGNGVPDWEDIANGTSEDCNRNDVPDECEDFGLSNTIDDSFEHARSVYAADVDGDGDIDVLGAANGANDITWWENAAGDGMVWIEHTVDGSFDGARSVYAADVDDDGDCDVLGSGDDGVAWWENTAGDGAVWTEHTVDGSIHSVVSVYAADVDGDGDLDVVGAFHPNITWWENRVGDGTLWIKHTVDGDLMGAQSVHATDVDGDGDMDILCAGDTGAEIRWWENTTGDGPGSIKHTVDGDFYGARSVYAADVDRDGDMDVVGASPWVDEVAWWENTAGDGTVWTKHLVASFDGALSVYATDVDGDGDIDVLGAGARANRFAWWENTAGDGAVWLEHPLDGSFECAASVYAADVDGDGDVDILGAAVNDNSITWWENLPVDCEGNDCPWDLDDDEVVGTGDLILLLGAWGDPYGTPDLIELLGNWGACPK